MRTFLVIPHSSEEVPFTPTPTVYTQYLYICSVGIDTTLLPLPFHLSLKAPIMPWKVSDENYLAAMDSDELSAARGRAPLFHDTRTVAQLIFKFLLTTTRHEDGIEYQRELSGLDELMVKG